MLKLLGRQITKSGCENFIHVLQISGVTFSKAPVVVDPLSFLWDFHHFHRALQHFMRFKQNPVKMAIIP